MRTLSNICLALGMLSILAGWAAPRRLEFYAVGVAVVFGLLSIFFKPVEEKK